MLKKSLIIVIDNTNNFNGFVEIDAVGHLSRQSTDATDDDNEDDDDDNDYNDDDDYCEESSWCHQRTERS